MTDLTLIKGDFKTSKNFTSWYKAAPVKPLTRKKLAKIVKKIKNDMGKPDKPFRAIVGRKVYELFRDEYRTRTLSAGLTGIDWV